MAQVIPVFDQMSLGSVTFSGLEAWVDLCSFGPNVNSPIPSGKQIWIGFLTCISSSKGGNFELRPNLPGQSAGSIATTQLRGLVCVPVEDSKDLDLYYNGAIISLAPASAPSTGVEKLWLRIKSPSASSATFEFIFYYSIY